MLIRTQAVLDDPSVTYWAKGAILALLNRDPVDAVADVELVLEVMKRELRAIDARYDTASASH